MLFLLRFLQNFPKFFFSPKRKFFSWQLSFCTCFHISNRFFYFLHFVNFSYFWSILAIFTQIIKKTQKNVAFVAFFARFWPKFSWCCGFYENFQKIFISPKQQLNSEQLLFWTSRHISILNPIFGQFWLFWQKSPKVNSVKNIWPRKKVDFDDEILKIFQKFFFHEKKSLIANNFHFERLFISLTVFSLKYIFQINLKNVGGPIWLLLLTKKSKITSIQKFHQFRNSKFFFISE